MAEARSREDAGADEARGLLTAALIGAAIGAGLGLLASRAMTDDSVVAAVERSGRRTGRAIRRRSREVSKSAAESLGDAREGVADFARHAREAFESALEREVKDLRRAARRQRRRLGL